MGEIVKAHISPCPECGENEWWMEIDTADNSQTKRSYVAE